MAISAPHSRSRLPTFLIAAALFDIALVCIIALRYSYSALSAAEAAVGLAILAAVAAFLWLYLVRAGHGADPTLRRALLAGVILGLLWAVEIAINNFIAPPLPTRDVIDNIFWAVIALSILVLAIVTAYQADSVLPGIEAGAWSRFVSGLVACTVALSVVVFAMPFITRDPLNVAEWAGRGPGTPAPTMAAYFAFETFAGGFLHLVVLGIGMGGLLGVLGGASGKAGRRLRDLVRRERSRQHRPRLG